MLRLGSFCIFLLKWCLILHRVVFSGLQIGFVLHKKVVLNLSKILVFGLKLKFDLQKIGFEWVCFSFVFILAVILVNCFVTCLWLILDVQLYDSGVAKDKSLALDPKFRAKKGNKSLLVKNRKPKPCAREKLCAKMGNSRLFIRKSRQTPCADPKFRAKRGIRVKKPKYCTKNKIIFII
jgi:hypothetical protein